MNRDPYMDNLRCFLIILVVIGHFLGKFSSIDLYKHLQLFIYLFHMPLFIFVSGYFSKSLFKNGVFQARKVISVFWMFLLFRLATYFITVLFKGYYTFNLFTDSSAPWYLLSLCLWYLFVPIIHNYKAKYVIPIAFICGILIGFDSSVGTFLSLSRTIVFFPFFCIGYYYTPEQLAKLLNKKLRIPSVVLLILTLCFILWKGELFSPYIRFTYGAASYKDLLDNNYLLYGPLIRMLWYLVAITLSIAVMYIIPRCHTWFTYIGQRTLSVYVGHSLIRNILIYEGLDTFLLSLPKIYTLLIFVICILIVLICSSSIVFKVFSYVLSHPFFIGCWNKKKQNN
ncbi:MAG: acyltransferase family protein [Clostridiales bacterium]|nr:acyltransferase family protein [Clostridiales bacterium]